MIGAGSAGRGVASLLLKKDARLQIRGIFDPDPRSVKAAVKLAGKQATVYPDHQSLLAAPDINWVMIASWNCFHRDQVIDAFRAGKDVFCQKPLATNLADCLDMYRTWRQSGKMFNIGFTLRYSPHYRAIRRLLDEKVIGDIISMEFNETIDFNHGGYIMGDWRRLTKYAGTHLLEKCCHDIDLANWMTGSRARRVASFGGLNFYLPKNKRHSRRLGKNKDGKKAYYTWGGLVGLNPFTSVKDIVDNQVAIIEYENGVRATFHANCHAGISERRMYILGSEGAIRADVFAGTIELRRVGFDEPLQRLDAGASGGHGGGDEVLATELADSMLKRRPPATGMDDAFASAATCFAIDQAMNSNRVVEVGAYWKKLARIVNLQRGRPEAQSLATDAGRLRPRSRSFFRSLGDSTMLHP
ncbi:MAG: Inositol 2-dehydrogenase/D-chiro-inositol 3-dehydrogenase [Verrucomicrobiae bacterium]|nr:Inositol 2-dehydrogenase/D-chiro-inositol 3-dehydrogenase [Verrucomicrobiae bacterium]